MAESPTETPILIFHGFQNRDPDHEIREGSGEHEKFFSEGSSKACRIGSIASKGTTQRIHVPPPAGAASAGCGGLLLPEQHRPPFPQGTCATMVLTQCADCVCV